MSTAYVIPHSPTLPLLLLRHSSFSNPSVALPTSQSSFSNLSQFTYVTTHSLTLPSLYPCHSSFSNSSLASRTSKFILQPFFRFSYVTSSSLNSPGKPLMGRLSLLWKPLVHILWELEDQSGDEEVKKNLHPADNRAIQPVLSALPLKLPGPEFDQIKIFFIYLNIHCYTKIKPISTFGVQGIESQIP